MTAETSAEFLDRMDKMGRLLDPEFAIKIATPDAVRMSELSGKWHFDVAVPACYLVWCVMDVRHKLLKRVAERLTA